MPRRQPFTALCQYAALKRSSGRADLHLHSTQSDGTYTPTQVVELAQRSGLSAVALTDHDTLDGIAEARAAAADRVEVITGTEITCEFRSKELHLLAYFIRPDNPALCAALERLRASRCQRFHDMVDRLFQLGVDLDGEEVHRLAASGTMGRRNLAELLVRERHVGSVREAFRRYLMEGGAVVTPKERLAVVEAIGLVRAAGGVAAWAHPSYDCTRESLAELAHHGLGAVEAEYPTMRNSRTRELRGWAAELGLAVSGGSDCHGPEPPQRTVGATTISAEEVELLRAKCP